MKISDSLKHNFTNTLEISRVKNQLRAIVGQFIQKVEGEISALEKSEETARKEAGSLAQIWIQSIKDQCKWAQKMLLLQAIKDQCILARESVKPLMQKIVTRFYETNEEYQSDLQTLASIHKTLVGANQIFLNRFKDNTG